MKTITLLIAVTLLTLLPVLPARAGNILVYSLSESWSGNRFFAKHVDEAEDVGRVSKYKGKSGWYVVVNVDTGRYRMIWYDKKYKEFGVEDCNPVKFSQFFVVTDAKNKETLVMSLYGLGHSDFDQWNQMDDSYAVFQTLSGGSKEQKIVTPSKQTFLIGAPSSLKGTNSYEGIVHDDDAEPGNSSFRAADGGKSSMKLDKKLSGKAMERFGADSTLRDGVNAVREFLGPNGKKYIESFIEATDVITGGNAADTQVMRDTTSGYGAVAHDYKIGKYEVTNWQYAEFLNAVAVTDTHYLYNTNMGSNARGGITQSGGAGSFTYTVRANMGDKPVNYVNFWDACRFCNWLHNGKPSGAQGATTTESGAYDLSDATAITNNTVTRTAGAEYFIPSEDEWYKAAYHDPVNAGADDGGTTDYWLYPTQSDSEPTEATATDTGDVSNPGVNVANYNLVADWNSQNGNVTTVGTAGNTSHYGAYDLGGNVWEWNEARPSAGRRGLRGGSWDFSDIVLQSSYRYIVPPFTANDDVGFRVAGKP